MSLSCWPLNALSHGTSDLPTTSIHPLFIAPLAGPPLACVFPHYTFILKGTKWVQRKGLSLPGSQQDQVFVQRHLFVDVSLSYSIENCIQFFPAFHIWFT